MCITQAPVQGLPPSLSAAARAPRTDRRRTTPRRSAGARTLHGHACWGCCRSQAVSCCMLSAVRGMRCAEPAGRPANATEEGGGVSQRTAGVSHRTVKKVARERLPQGLSHTPGCTETTSVSRVLPPRPLIVSRRNQRKAKESEKQQRHSATEQQSNRPSRRPSRRSLPGCRSRTASAPPWVALHARWALAWRALAWRALAWWTRRCGLDLQGPAAPSGAGGEYLRASLP